MALRVFLHVKVAGVHARRGWEAMTSVQEKQIGILRMKGIGYKAIASGLGVSRDVIRNYCKIHGLEGKTILRN